MADKGGNPTEAFTAMLAAQSQAMLQRLSQMAESGDAAHWAAVGQRLQTMWLEYQTEQAMKKLSPAALIANPNQWVEQLEDWVRQSPLGNPDAGQRAWEDGMALWNSALNQLGLGEETAKPTSPNQNDRRFADEAWQNQPFFDVLRQSYLMIAGQITAMADGADIADPERKQQLQFAAQALTDAFSPSNFAATNPQVITRALETKGESLINGMQHMLNDLRRGQLTHTDPEAFKLGENIAVTPGKVVHETPLYQLIQYDPATPDVLAVPLLIFPPWINRFYILDLNPKKSFVRWAVEQGVTVFMVSWKSADASMSDVVWDDYIAAQMDAIDTVRARLAVPAVHTIGYCVAGTTLAATLAILARQGKAGHVKSATFFTAQVDFADAGELLHFVDEKQIETIGKLSPEGYLDGRYMAATFNLLRGNDLIWNYVVNNYLLGQDYPAFDLLHWNGDVTNLPVKWHQAYLRDLYRDNRLVVPDSMQACGVGIDLGRIETPSYIQAGREDHIAPLPSVWKLTEQFNGENTFLLAGSGHIAGVVNPPSAQKYQYWTNDSGAESLEAFIAGATEHPGSWWPHWIAWLRAQDGAVVPAKGKRKPGGKGDKVIEDAPGRYVKSR